METEYQSEKTDDARRYLLPNRPIGGPGSKLGKYARMAAIFGTIVAALLFIFGVLPMLVAIVSLIIQFFQPPGNNVPVIDTFGKVSTLVFGIPVMGFAFYVVKFTLLAFAISQGKSRCDVLVGLKDVVHHEKFFGFGFKFRQPIKDIENVYLDPLVSEEAETSADRKDGYDFLLRLVPEGTHAIGFKKHHSVPVAFGYTLDVLNPLAEDIRRDLVRENVSGREEIEVVKRTTYLPTKDDRIAIINGADADSTQWENLDEDGFRIDPPEDSLIEVIQQDEAVVYRMPKRGFFGVGITAWLAAVFAAVITVVSALILSQGKPINVETVVVMGGFAIAALAAIAAVYYFGSREAMLGVDGGRLFIEEKSIFGTRWTEFTESQLDRVAVEDSDISVNDVPIKHLVIRPKEGKSQGMLSRLSNQELYWLSQQIRQQLDFKDTKKERLNSLFDEHGEIADPGKTRLSVDTQPDATQITIPRTTNGRALLHLCSPILIACAAVAFSIYSISNGELFLAFLAAGFAVVTVGIMIAMLAYFSRSFHVMVDSSQIVIRRAGLLSKKTFRLSRAEFKAVKVKNSGTVINGKPMYRLAFDSTERQSVFKMMKGWSVPELKHVAAHITKRIGDQLETN